MGYKSNGRESRTSDQARQAKPFDLFDLCQLFVRIHLPA